MRTLIVMIVEKHVKVPAGFGSNHIYICFSFFCLGACQKRFSKLSKASSWDDLRLAGR